MICCNLYYVYIWYIYITIGFSFISFQKYYTTFSQVLLLYISFHYVDNSMYTFILYLVFISDVCVQRCYFGSEHDKGEADGETGVIAHAVDPMISSSRLTVRNAKDYADFCKEHLQREEPCFKRHFFLVGPTDIDHNRWVTIDKVFMFSIIMLVSIMYSLLFLISFAFQNVSI